MTNTLKSVSLVFMGVVCALFIGISSSVAAVDVFQACDSTGAKQTDVCQNVDTSKKSGVNPIIDILKVTITILSVIIGITAVIMIIVSGLWLMTANGDAQAISRARSSIIYALVGVVIVTISQVLVTFVLNKL